MAALRASLRQLDWRIVGIATLNFAHRFFFAGVYVGTFGLYLGNLAGPEAAVSAVAIGVASLTAVLLFAQNALTLLMSPAAGYLSDRLGDRSRVLLLGEVMGVLGLALLALGSSVVQAAFGVVLIAAVYGIVPPLVMSWMGDLSRTEHRGITVGIFQTMGDIGSGLGPLVAYLLLATFGIRWVYGASAVVLALTLPLILLLRARTRLATA